MITLPQNFEADIQGQNLNLTTLVQITQLNGDKIYISTGSINFDGNYYKPILLNIPSVKESMDFENRNYKISNSTLSVSNYEVGGSVFSDSLIDSDGNYIINARVDIYWKSQSATTIDDCLNIYNAIIRRVSHDDKNVKLSLEDSTQKDLHKDVPVARLRDTNEVLSKYKLKPIPMVYGFVNNSPLIVREYSQTDGTGIIIADDIGNPARPNLSVSILTDEYNTVNPLKIFSNDLYSHVLIDSENYSHWGYTSEKQYTFIAGDGHIDFIAATSTDDTSGGIQYSPLSDDSAEVILYAKPNRYKVFNWNDNFYSSYNDKWYRYYANEMNDTVWTGKTWDEVYTEQGELSTRQEDNHRVSATFSPSLDKADSELLVGLKYDFEVFLNGIIHDNDFTGLNFYILLGAAISSDTWDRVFEHDTTSDYYNPNLSGVLELGWMGELPAECIIFNSWTYPQNTPGEDGDYYGGNLTFDINKFFLVANYLIKDFTTSDFYANVNGRTDDNYSL